VTERGIAINPRRTDLMELTKKSGLPIKSMEELKAEADRICGVPEPPEVTDRVVAAIKWVDGTLIDVVKQVSR
ncbi:MAG: citrate lyase subunit alpha, partial [Bacteroidales bacterium]|nr:citrate lyase subunit alpha [Bacteroidales bacterium]